MIDIQGEIGKFLEALHMAVLYPVKMDLSGDVPAMLVNNLFIYIYPPHGARRPNIPGFQTIHLDVDLLLSARHKIINRIKGLLGIGTRLYARDTVVARI